MTMMITISRDAKEGDGMGKEERATTAKNATPKRQKGRRGNGFVFVFVVVVVVVLLFFLVVGKKTTLVFDLDGVLYPASNGYLEKVRNNQRNYLIEKHGVSEEEARKIRKEAFAKHNQTLKGLRSLASTSTTTSLPST